MKCPANLGEDGARVFMTNEAVDILVVEDNDSERASIVTALQHSIPGVAVIGFRNGEEALDFLLGRGMWRDRAGENPPKLILLDLGLPGSDGFALLDKIRTFQAHEAMTLTPVVVFTNSQSLRDISKSYQYGANSYVTKPMNYTRFQTVVKAVGRYWLTHNRSPVHLN